jgi:5-methylcytosine-specific restriction enzyme subunit McrC
MGRLIKVFEHERLTLHSDSWGRKLSPPELKKLYDFNDKNNNIYFTGIRDGVKFSSYVGVIQIGNLTLEILPKADRTKENTEKEFEQASLKWRNVLLKMLAVCNHIRVDAVSEASLHRRYSSILDLYFEIFLDEVEILLRKGLIKQYRVNEGNMGILKGRIDFAQNIQKNLMHRELFYTHHQVYNHDHLINQVLQHALLILNRVSLNGKLKDRLARIKLDMPEVSNIVIQKNHFDKLPDNRKTVMYREALKIARMIILNYSPDIKTGHENMLALLFDMNQLWEEYIYRMLLKYKSENFKISYQNSKVFWETESLSKKIRPDLVIQFSEQDKKENFIIDTKWKIIDYRNPGDDDLKQMYAYNMYWNAGRSMLLYPGTCNFPELWGVFPKGIDYENKCKIGFVNVLDKEAKGLNLNIGQEILKKLEIEVA